MAQNVTTTPPKVRSVLSAYKDASSSGATEVIAAPAGAGSAIRVLSLALVSTAANSVKFLSASTQLTGTYPLAANGGLVLPYNEHGWFQCAGGEALNINMSAATATGMTLQYIIL